MIEYSSLIYDIIIPTSLLLVVILLLFIALLKQSDTLYYVSFFIIFAEFFRLLLSYDFNPSAIIWFFRLLYLMVFVIVLPHVMKSALLMGPEEYY